MEITTNADGSVTITTTDTTITIAGVGAAIASATASSGLTLSPDYIGPANPPAPPTLPLVFSDDFSSGGLATVGPSGACWAGVNLSPGGGSNVSTSDGATGGSIVASTNGLAFTYPAQPQGGQCLVEQDGYLGAPMSKGVRIQFGLAVPINYIHRGGGSQYPSGTPSSNNKFLAIYRNPNTPGQLVSDWNMTWNTTLCTWPTPTGGSSLSLSLYDNDVEQPIIPFAPNFITSADLGKTMQVSCCVVLPSSAGNDGQFWFFKNGELLFYKNDCANPIAALTSFYLLGACNSGFTSQTALTISDVQVFAQ